MKDIFKEYMHKLTSAFNTEYGQNLQKVVRFFAWSLSDVRDEFNGIATYRNIDKASGILLDDIGEKLNEKRGQADDRFYRIMLKSKIAARRGDTTANGILTTIKNAFDVDVRGMKIIKHEDEPLAISIIDIPLDVAKTDWERNYLMRRIKNTVAVGVRVHEVRLIDSTKTTVLVISGTNNAIVYDFLLYKYPSPR
ncbi:MAG: hypothetical protein K2O72_04920 [Ligilactobacillus sp.]|nr:hypothetical protein [Ligilactobacillus sp.]